MVVPGEFACLAAVNIYGHCLAWTERHVRVDARKLNSDGEDIMVVKTAA